MSRLTSLGSRAALSTAALVLGCGAIIASSHEPTVVSADPVLAPQFQVAQGFTGSPGSFQGSGLGFQGPGFSRPGGGGPLQSGRSGVLGSQSVQGGVFSSNNSGVVPSGRTLRLAAFCTDLLSEPPDAATRFRGGEKAQITLGDGRRMTLAAALDTGLLALRGRNEALNPFRPGGLALSLELVNTSPVPVRVDIPAGEAVTPAGQSEQPLPPGSDRLFAVAAEERLTQSNTLQYAVWAARGSTAEEVEQANMTRLPEQEGKRVQELLNASGIERKFDRERGAYAARYRAAADKLGADAQTVDGTASLPNGGTAEVECLRGDEGTGLVTVRKDGAEYFYRGEFRNRKDGKLDVTLKHLVTGRRIHPYRGYLLVRPA